MKKAPFDVVEPTVYRSNGREIFRHPAYGQMTVSRTTGERVLHGSDFLHNRYITLTINTSEMHRNLSSDWHHAEKQLIQVALSEAQWAAFVSSLNVGDGVPCTLDRVAGERVPSLPPIDRRAQFSREVDDRLAHAVDLLDALARDLDTAKIAKKTADELKVRIRMARQEMTSNIAFVAEQFGEHVEKTIEDAKVEVHAYATATLLKAGIGALAGGEAPHLIGNDERDDQADD